MAISRKNIDRSYKGMELNEEKVRFIFDACLAKEGAPKDECLRSVLFPTVAGYSSDAEKLLFFNKKRLLMFKKDIQYMYGQLKNAHAPHSDYRMNIEETFIDYKGNKWTTNTGILLEFLYLGAAEKIHIISPFTKASDTTNFDTTTVKPTLSPKDPNYPTWMAEHKAEWNAEG